MSPPRLTGALRSFSTVSKQEDVTLQLCDLKAKRLKRQELFAREGLTWPKVVQFFTEHLEKRKKQATSQELRCILQAAKQIVGTDYGQDTIESAAVFLFKTFHNKDQVGHEETRAIKQMFGPFPASAAEAASSAVGRLVAQIGESQVEAFIQTQTSHKPLDHGATFGRNITFSFDTYMLDTQDTLPWEEEPGEGRGLDFNSFLSNHVSGRGNDGEGVLQVGALAQSTADGSILRREVEKYLSGGNMVSSSAEELCASLFEMLASTKSDDELQNELFELLGPEGFEMISTLLQRRPDIVDSLLSAPSDGKFSYTPGVESAKPVYGCQVTIQSEQERQMMKLYRREEKRERKRERRGEDGDPPEPSFHFDPKELRLQREQALLTARRSPVLGRQRDYERIHYPHVYDAYAEASKTSAFIGGSKMLLPEGIQRENNKLFEQVDIPPNEPMPIGFQEKPVYISELDEIGQLVFKGMKRLNRIQSIVFETAYNTNENLLICAPTGAGKTNIAMLTVLHEIRQHLQPGGVIRKDQFKIVYVAPMKALAAEMTNYFSKRLEPLGIAVKELTGDMQLSKGEILRTQMLVTTPEKWDVVTRKSVGDVALSQLVRLLILDEVHLLHEDRGPVLESLVARTLRQVESTQSMIRILGLSATLPNYLDVASFLHVNPYIGLFFFDSRFRPVPLGQTFVGIKTTNKIQQLHDMDEVCYDKVLKQIKAGHQVMVFVHARNSTVRTAMSLIEMAKNRGESSFFQPDHGPDYGQCDKQNLLCWLDSSR
ncbi:activating signal cointegrator 1 complex subunit 3 isoform X3 [Brachyhypopomus gauderio]|uniref:activating signal cointegrator 1 complex subunit 3 isoform X3 n=1 Tax=Brachyhypopomus gauderio TaxID=698409 RepID=UPI00404286C9